MIYHINIFDYIKYKKILLSIVFYLDYWHYCINISFIVYYISVFSVSVHHVCFSILPAAVLMHKLCFIPLKQHCLPYHLILQPSLPQSICPSLLYPVILGFMQSLWLPCSYSRKPYFHLLILRRNLNSAVAGKPTHIRWGHSRNWSQSRTNLLFQSCRAQACCVKSNPNNKCDNSVWRVLAWLTPADVCIW